MRRITATTALALALGLAATAVAAPEDPGSLGVTKTTVQVPVDGTTQLATDVYVPQAAGPFPIVVIRHGFARNKSFWVNWGNHLASRGIIALIPTSRAPFQPDPDRDSDDQLAVLAWGVTQNAVSGSTLEGKVDASRRAIGGHSAGGLCSVMAATKDSTLRAAVLFDEVDVSGTGVAAAPSIAIPSISMIAEPGTCNSNANGVGIFQAIGGPKYGIKVTNSEHCDPEDPSDYLCGAACNGQVQPQYQLLYRRYATAFLEAFLNCDPAAYPYVNGTFATTDTAISIYPETNIVVPPPACSQSDAGTPQNDAGQADAGQVDAAQADALHYPDAMDYPDGAAADGGGAGDAGNGGGGSDCGCRAAPVSAGPAGLLVVAALLALRRRRS